jgi:hypothetical protein
MERTDPNMARTVRENMSETIETIETNLLYPERKKQEDKKGETIK